jgi:hypothetical protein
MPRCASSSNQFISLTTEHHQAVAILCVVDSGPDQEGLSESSSADHQNPTQGNASVIRSVPSAGKAETPVRAASESPSAAIEGARYQNRVFTGVAIRP